MRMATRRDNPQTRRTMDDGRHIGGMAKIDVNVKVELLDAIQSSYNLTVLVLSTP